MMEPLSVRQIIARQTDTADVDSKRLQQTFTADVYSRRLRQTRRRRASCRRRGFCDHVQHFHHPHQSGDSLNTIDGSEVQR